MSSEEYLFTVLFSPGGGRQVVDHPFEAGVHYDGTGFQLVTNSPRSVFFVACSTPMADRMAVAAHARTPFSVTAVYNTSLATAHTMPFAFRFYVHREAALSQFSDMGFCYGEDALCAVLRAHAHDVIQEPEWVRAMSHRKHHPRQVRRIASIQPATAQRAAASRFDIAPALPPIRALHNATGERPTPMSDPASEPQRPPRMRATTQPPTAPCAERQLLTPCQQRAVRRMLSIEHEVAPQHHVNGIRITDGWQFDMLAGVMRRSFTPLLGDAAHMNGAARVDGVTDGAWIPRCAILTAPPGAGRRRVILEAARRGKTAVPDAASVMRETCAHNLIELGATLIACSEESVHSWQADARAMGVRLNAVSTELEFRSISLQALQHADVTVVALPLLAQLLGDEASTVADAHAAMCTAFEPSRYGATCTPAAPTPHSPPYERACRWLTSVLARRFPATHVPWTRFMWRRIVVDDIDYHDDAPIRTALAALHAAHAWLSVVKITALCDMPLPAALLAACAPFMRLPTHATSDGVGVLPSVYAHVHTHRLVRLAHDVARGAVIDHSTTGEVIGEAELAILKHGTRVSIGEDDAMRVARRSLGMLEGANYVSLTRRALPMSPHAAMDQLREHYTLGGVARQQDFAVRVAQAFIDGTPPVCPVCGDAPAMCVPVCGHALCEACKHGTQRVQGANLACSVCKQPQTMLDWLHIDTLVSDADATLHARSARPAKVQTILRMCDGARDGEYLLVVVPDDALVTHLYDMMRPCLPARVHLTKLEATPEADAVEHLCAAATLVNEGVRVVIAPLSVIMSALLARQAMPVPAVIILTSPLSTFRRATDMVHSEILNKSIMAMLLRFGGDCVSARRSIRQLWHNSFEEDLAEAGRKVWERCLASCAGHEDDMTCE
jgi:hypothetical protein